MEGKKSIKVSLGTVICMFIIFILIISLIGMYVHYNYIPTDNKNKVETNNEISISNKNESEESSNSETNNKYGKTYSEIINSLNINNFDKNKFTGEFLIKKVNNLLLNNISYYNINGELVDEYVPETVLATWDDISNYESDLYKGLNLNKEIQFSSYMIYRNNLPNETTFYLQANKTDYSANETIKDSFNNNNVGLFWSANDTNIIPNSIKANEVISVSNELRKKWNNNELGIFIELLGEPSRIYKMPDINKKDAGIAYDEIEFDLIKTYYLFWEYDEYYVRMIVDYMIDGETEKNNSISQILVKSKNSNSTVGDYKTDISMAEQSAEK